MGGQIHVESVPNEGSTFRFDIELGLAATFAEEAAHELTTLDGVKTLVVDDNPISRRVVTGYAHKLGMIPTAVTGGDEALRFARHAALNGEPYQLVFSDCRMPGMDGFEFARQLREDPQLSATPLVLLSSLDPASFSQAERDLHISQSLTKPVTPDEMAVAALSALAESPRAPKTSRTGVWQTSATPLRILVAEDNAINQRLILRVLEKIGHSVRIVENGGQALAAAESNAYDRVVLDGLIPEMAGFDATRRIRAHTSPDVRKLPILALTAHALAGDRQRCLDAGMSDYLTKPVDAASLAAMIEALAGRGHSQ
jgi:CheY-like chemotaxis protein